MGIKKILIVSTKEPFINGGDSVLINSLAQELSKNFEVEKILIPFSTNSDLIEEQIDGIRKLKFSYGDLAITSRPLSYAIKHPNKIVWFMHHLRHFYELWDTEFNPLKKEKDKFSELRKKIIEYDNKFLRECRKIFAISENVRKRLKEYNNLSSETIYPPISNPEKFKCHQYKDYFFYPSRITSNKRQHLVIEALKYTKGKYKLILAGQVDDKYFNKKIRPLLDNPNIKERIEILGYIDEEKKIDLYSDCLGVIFTPFDEDYGYITIESFYSSKMVITTNDSGGPLEFIKNEQTGIITDPDPISLAKAMDNIFENQEKAISMGKNAKNYISSLDISWEKAINKLIPQSIFDKVNILNKVIKGIFR